MAWKSFPFGWNPRAEEGAGTIDAKVDQYPETVCDASSGLAQITSPVCNELQRVESLLRSELNSDEPWLAELINGVQCLGGKRMRPLMLLLFGLATGKVEDSHLRASVAFELVHLATLVHDDVIDCAGMRRGQPTLHQRQGIRPAILTGDYLFARAFVVASQIGCAELIGDLARAVGRVCCGEIRQNHFAGNLELALEDYIEIVSAKTASLCASACRNGVLLNTRDPKLSDAAWLFGNHVGVAFQVIDDCLDLEGSAEVVGKTLGTDAAAGKLTYPLIHALAFNGGQYSEPIQRCLNSAANGAAEDLVLLLEETDSLTAARLFADQQVELARDTLAEFPCSDAQVGLSRLADFVIRRQW